jgi:hypothetical protein
MRLTQDDCPSITVSQLRTLGAVTEDMASVRVTIGEVSREVRLSHRRFPNGGGWSFFLCPSCGRRARVLKLFERIACWRCTKFEGKPLPHRVQLGDRSQRIKRLRQRLDGGPSRARPRPGRRLEWLPDAYSCTPYLYSLRHRWQVGAQRPSVGDVGIAQDDSAIQPLS